MSYIAGAYGADAFAAPVNWQALGTIEFIPSVILEF